MPEDSVTRNMSSVRIPLICAGGYNWIDGDGVLWRKGEGSEEVAWQSVDRGFSENIDSPWKIELFWHTMIARLVQRYC